MIRLTLWLLGALLLAGIVHLATVLLLPRMATQDAYARVSAIAPVNSVIPIPGPTPEKALMPFMDPAFQVSVCRYDLSRGPLKFSVPISQAYTSVSFYTRSDVAYYAINDRAAGRRMIELDLMTTAQRAELPENEEITAADRLIVTSPTTAGLIVIRGDILEMILGGSRGQPRTPRNDRVATSRAVGTPPPTAARSTARLGFEIPARRLSMSFDPNDRENNYRG